MARTGRRPAFDPGDPLLPVAGTGVLSGVRRSRRSRWRAGVLIGVHVLIALHIAHFVIRGSTLSPVEPSEAMYTLELGQVNAGFVFFLAALLSTAIFGRFFCGWGCHIVALQDLCGWILKRLSIRPRPFRSRLLLLAPLILALYMFVWPTVKRLVAPVAAQDFPGFTNHLVTAGFWDTFPGPLFAVLTFLTCGFAAVYFLGAKGFCTYGCPYGAFFGALDRVAPGRILVTDDCEQCGHCTATCTSNVRVHDEVRQFGRVVDPGCMKCMDCVSVCPKNALYYGFARPLALSGRAAKPDAPRRPLPLGHELLVGAVCLLATLAFRGLYDGPPLLMSLGLGGISAYLALLLWRLLRSPTVRLQNLNLKLGGETRRAGRIVAVLLLAWFVFTAHSGFVQWHRQRGRAALERSEATRAEVLSGAHRSRAYSAEHTAATERAWRHFGLADRWGLVPVLEVKLGLCWTHLLRDDVDAAEARLREAIALAPSRGDLRDDLIQILAGHGRTSAATAALEDQIDAGVSSPEDACRMAERLAAADDRAPAIRLYSQCAAGFPEAFEARYNLGGLLRRSDRPAEAVAHLAAAARLRPGDVDAQVELGLAYMALGEAAAARAALVRAIELDPQTPEARFHLPGLIRQLDAALAGATSRPSP